MPEKILIVEDEKDLVQILEYNLNKKGYAAMAALDGLTACRMIEEEKPDLVLLDLMLPDLNGWDICKLIRSHEDEEISETPIIMLTALGSPEDKIRGLELGADDYIPKPFVIKEVLLKVGRMIRKAKKDKQLNIKIKNLESRKNRQIDFQNILFHELKSQLIVISGFSSRMEKKGNGISPDRHQYYAGIIKECSSSLILLAEEMLLLARLETGAYPLPMENICFEETIRQIISIFFEQAKEKDIFIEFKKIGKIPQTRLNSAGLKVSLSSIIENGIKYSSQKTCLKIKLLSQEENMIVIEVRDNGPGIPKKDMDKIFTKFYRGENVKYKTKGTGLGLYTAKTVVEAMGGRITVESTNGKGSCFRIEFKQTHKKLEPIVKKQFSFDAEQFHLQLNK